LRRFAESLVHEIGVSGDSSAAEPVGIFHMRFVSCGFSGWGDEVRVGRKLSFSFLPTSAFYF
jgi:hypothetical protein